jgi:hypothetical protein
MQTEDLVYLGDEVFADTRILLHIDLDFFNNRYDANPASVRTASRHDPALLMCTKKFESLLDQLLASGRVSQIENVAIAISPGFTPSELWRPLLKLVFTGLQSIGCVTPV